MTDMYDYSYNAAGHLVVVKRNGTTVAAYTYNSNGNPISYRSRAGTVNGALVQGFLYQDPLKPVAELDRANNVVSRFVYATAPNVRDHIIRGAAIHNVLTTCA